MLLPILRRDRSNKLYCFEAVTCSSHSTRSPSGIRLIRPSPGRNRVAKAKDTWQTLPYLDPGNILSCVFPVPFGHTRPNASHHEPIIITVNCCFRQPSWCCGITVLGVCSEHNCRLEHTNQIACRQQGHHWATPRSMNQTLLTDGRQQNSKVKVVMAAVEAMGRSGSREAWPSSGFSRPNFGAPRRL